jgi:hypothetical protein
MATITINHTGIGFGGNEPRYDAPLPSHFPTGHPIHPEPGIYTVYSWCAAEAAWHGLMSATVCDDACQMVRELVAELRGKGVPAAYRVEEGIND